MDFYTNLTFKFQKGRGLGSRDPISKFWDLPYNFRMNRAIHFKFGTDITDGPLLHMDHKTAPGIQPVNKTRLICYLEFDCHLHFLQQNTVWMLNVVDNHSCVTNTNHRFT